MFPSGAWEVFPPPGFYWQAFNLPLGRGNSKVWEMNNKCVLPCILGHFFGGQGKKWWVEEHLDWKYTGKVQGGIFHSRCKTLHSNVFKILANHESGKKKKKWTFCMLFPSYYQVIQQPSLWKERTGTLCPWTLPLQTGLVCHQFSVAWLILSSPALACTWAEWGSRRQHGRQMLRKEKGWLVLIPSMWKHAQLILNPIKRLNLIC